MLRFDLARMGREGSVSVEARIPAEDPLWGELGVSLQGPVEVELTAFSAGTGEIVVRGRVEAEFEQECRRCLEPVSGELGLDVTMVFVPSDTPGAEDDADARVFDARAPELDLSESVREEMVLAIDLYVVCDPECKGLCPRCGANRNAESCDCVEEEVDPRWDALRSLHKE